MSLECLWVIGKEGVDQTKQLHDSLILTQILVPLQEEHKFPTIAPWRGEQGKHYSPSFILGVSATRALP